MNSLIKSIHKRFIYYFATIVLLVINDCAYSNTIYLTGTQIINKDTHYQRVVFNLNQGGFIVDKKATLTIEDSVINVIISPDNPYFSLLTTGNLILKNNIFNVTTNHIIPNPNSQTVFFLIRIKEGGVFIANNEFNVNQDYSVGFLFTEGKSLTTNININHNFINHFHGGIYLINSNKARISNNQFWRVSYGNVFLKGNNDTIIKNNYFKFPGNLQPGDAIDIIDSDHIEINENKISDDSCYGMQIIGSQNILIDKNDITNGITFGISIVPLEDVFAENNYLAKFLKKQPIKRSSSNNITITNNYLSLNRYGISAKFVAGLVVNNNIFIQKFIDDKSRLTWTDNDFLLKQSTNIQWENNIYKEAFIQEAQGDNKPSLQFVIYPAHGGVRL